MFNKSILILCLFMCSSLFSSLSYSEIIFGPETFQSTNAELTSHYRTLDLGSLPNGKYLIQIQNGVNGPGLFKQCDTKATIELKRQCQYDNLVDRIENNLTRADRLFISVNNKKIINRSLISKGTSYLEFPVEFKTTNNQLKFEIQGSPEAIVQIKIVTINGVLLPNPLFTINSNHGKSPFKLSFNASQSFDPLNKQLTYEWILNDQVISTVKSGSINLTQTGVHQLKLKVTNSDGSFGETPAADIVVKPANNPNPPANKKPLLNVQITKPDPMNLRKVHIDSSNSVDPDGTIVKTEIFTGTGFKTLAKQTEFTYPDDGTYLIKVIATDDQGAKSSFERSISIVGSNSLVPIQSILGPKKYYGSFSAQNTYLESIQLNPLDTQSLYKLTIKNADGLDHPITNCTGSLSQKILCNYNNWINSAYISLYRVDWAKIEINNKRLTDSSSLNKKKSIYETYLKLSEVNQLKITLKGWPTSYVDVHLEKLGEDVDRVAPVISANILSGSLTNQNIFHISVLDNSNTTTEVYKEGQLILTTVNKEFDINLTEGINRFIIKSKDQYNNIADDLVLENIIVDTTAPVATYSNFKTIYYYQQTPEAIQIDFQFNEALSSFTINQQTVPVIGTLFSYQLPVSGPGYYQLNAQATDLAGNSAQRTLTLRLVVDSQAPNITLGSTPDLIDLDQISFPVTITDLIGTVSQVKVNGNTILSGIVSPQFMVSYPTVAEGIYNFEITVIDLAGNITVFNKIITKRSDIVPPNISHNINPETYVRSFPRMVTYQFHTNEPLSQLSVNGQTLNPIDTANYVYNFETTQSGNYTFLISATDLSGNRTQFTAQTTINQDSEPPEIITGPIPGIINENTYLFKYEIVDSNSTWTTFILDGVQFPSTSEKNVSFLLDFTQQNIHEIILIVTDLAGNSTSQYYKITKNTAPLAVNFMSPQPAATYPSQNLQIRLQANKPLTAASINGVPVTINNDQISFGQNLTVPNEGQYTFTAQVTDIYGQTAQTQVTFEVKTRSIASWEYQECPAQ